MFPPHQHAFSHLSPYCGPTMHRSPQIPHILLQSEPSPRENRITMDRLCGARQRRAAINQKQYSLFARVEESSLSFDPEVNPCFGEKTLPPKLKGR